MVGKQLHVFGSQFRDLGDRLGQANALNKRGTLHPVNGDLAQAEGCH